MHPLSILIIAPYNCKDSRQNNSRTHWYFYVIVPYWTGSNDNWKSSVENPSSEIHKDQLGLMRGTFFGTKNPQ